jgi:hypothetical protein
MACSRSASTNVARSVVFIVVSTVAACPADELRVETRASVSGRVVLADIDGLNDESRIRIDLGRGEGGAVVDDDGVFIVSDLEADIYTLTVTYTGGLTPVASRSAYLPFSRRVPLSAGSNVDVGDLVLLLASGRVSGTVIATDDTGAPVAPGGIARLSSPGSTDVRTTAVLPDGTFAFDDVPVGFHTVAVERDGFAVPDDGAVSAAARHVFSAGNLERACGAPATVAQADDDVVTPPLRQMRGTPGLVPGATDLYSTDGGTWWVRPGVTTLSPHVATGFAAVARVWLRSDVAAPEFTPVLDERRIAVNEGRDVLRVQVGDGCGYESDVVDIPVVVDATPPSVFALDVAGAVLGGGDEVLLAPTSGVLPVVVTAADDIAGVAGVAAVLLPAGATPSPEDLLALDFSRLEPSPSAQVVVDVALTDGDGAWTLLVQARDAVGNLSTPAIRGVVVDTTAPVVRSIVIGDGSAVTNDDTPIVRVVAEDAGAGVATMQVTTTATFADPPRPFSSNLVVPLDDGVAGDGVRNVAVRIVDAVGNASESSATVRLDRRAPTGSLQRVGGGTALPARGPVRIVVEHDDDVAAVGVGLLEGACGGANPAPPDGPAHTERTIDVQGPDGVVVVRACLRDAAGNQTALTQAFSLDTTAPVGAITVENGAPFVRNATVDVAVSTTEPGVLIRFGEAAVTDVPAAEIACAGDVGYAPARSSERLTLAAEGARVVWACLRDTSGNTGFVVDDIVFDATAPAVRSIVVGDGSGVTTQAEVTVALDVEGASEMKLGLLPGLSGAAFQPYRSEARVVVGTGDGEKTVFFRFRDPAGNESAEEARAITLDTAGSVSGRVFVEGRADSGNVEVRLAGSTFSTNAASDGSWTIASVPAGLYTVEAAVRAVDDEAGAFVVAQAGVAVEARRATTTSDLFVTRKRGNVALSVRLEDEADAGGVVVEVVGAGVTAVSDVLGNVDLANVPVGTYNLRLSRVNYTGREITGVAVGHRTTTTVATTTLSLNRGAISGRAVLDDADDFSGVVVSLLGTDIAATTDLLGEFVLTGVKPGTWNVIAQKSGYDVARLNSLFVGPGQGIDLGVLPLTRKRGVVVGRVTVDGVANVDGVVVGILNTGFRALPQSNGDFSFSIPVGNYDGVVAQKSFYDNAIAREVVTVTEVGNYTVAPLVLRGQSGVVDGVVRLAGAAIGAEDGSTVTLEGAPGSTVDGVVVRATTLADGSYSFDQPEDFVVLSQGPFPVSGSGFAFRGIPNGPYRLTARERVDNADGRDIVVRDVVVQTATTTTENVELRKVFVRINGGAAATTNRLVTLDLGATDCFRMRLSLNDAPAPGQPFVPCSTPVTNFSLGDVDGVRTVFAEFMNSAEELLPVASASILLDTTADVASFTHDVPAGTKKTVGDRVTFSASTGESGGRAIVNLSGYDSNIVLNDLGGGSYGASYLLRTRTDVQPTAVNATTGPGVVTLTFTDRFGNIATANANTTTTSGTKTTTPTPVAIAAPPIVSNIQIIPDLVAQTARVTFTTDETATSVVRVGQLENSLCTTTCATTTAGTSHSVVLTGTQAGEPGGLLLRNKRYFVRIEATDTKGNVAVTAILSFFLQPDPPRMVLPVPMDSRVLLRWEAPPQEDLSGYFVERSENGGAFVRISGAAPYNHEVLTFDDRTVVNGRQYAYRVRAVDLFGNASDPGTTTDMAKNADGTFDATKLVAFNTCGTVTPTPATSTAGTDIGGGVLPLCTVWTNAGSPFRVNGSIAVPTGGIFIVGPSVDVRMAADTQIVVQGRIGVYGDRGRFFSVENKIPDSLTASASSGLPSEDPAGRSTFTSPSGNWRGIVVRRGSNQQAQSISSSYLSGSILFRTTIASIKGSAINTDTPFTFTRTNLESTATGTSGDEAIGAGAAVTGNGIALARPYESAQRWLPAGSILNDSVAESLRGPGEGGSLYFSGFVDGSYIRREGGRAGVEPYFASDSLVIERFRTLRSDNAAETTRLLRSRLSFQAETNSANILTAYGSTIELIFGRIPGPISVSEVIGINPTTLTLSRVAQGGSPAEPDMSIVSSHLWGTFIFPNPIGDRVRSGTLMSASCAVDSRLVAPAEVSTITRAPRLALECGTVTNGNITDFTDFNDNVALGTLALDTTFSGSFPRPMVDGPQILNLPAVKRGITLRIYGDDLEDGPLPAAAGYWTSSSGVRIGDGPLLTLPTTLGVGTTTFTAHVVDADGNDSDIPWPVEVKNDPTLADNWMWPDRDRWRIAALRFDQLPPRSNATDVGTFRWRCFTPGCTTTCAIDPDPNADVTAVATEPCRSPVEVAGLSSGTHTFVVQPRDAEGNAIDLPQRYVWTVAAANRFDSVHPAAVLRLFPGPEHSATVTMASADTGRAVVTCSVDGRHEVPCNAGLSISGIGGNGDFARELVIRVRARANGQELFSPRTLRLNDPDDVDGDGWLDGDDPCLAGAERGANCFDPDVDGVEDPSDLCPLGRVANRGFSQVTAGNRHVCGLLVDGGVACTGQNASGQLGDGTTTSQSRAVGVVQVGSSPEDRAVQIDAGLEFTCALLVDGAVRCWGKNDFGQLGDGTTTNSSVPVAVIGVNDAVAVTAGGQHACALRSTGAVVCWGRNDVGQLGDGTFSSPRRNAVTVSGLTDVVDVAAGQQHTCAVLASGGVRCWGENNNGRLGDGDAAGDINRSTPVVVTGMTDAITIESGRAQTCALRTGGALSCWGDNREAGALGIGTLVGQATPAQSFSDGVRRIAIGIEDGAALSLTTTICAVTSSGFKCWGRNAEGQYGVGNTTGSASPVLVAGAADAVDVAVGNGFACMVRADATISCWGRGAEGQLGDGGSSQVNSVPTTSPAGWSPLPYFRGPLVNDGDGDGCEDAP